MSLIERGVRLSIPSKKVNQGVRAGGRALIPVQGMVLVSDGSAFASR
jgi:hypothetical protein